MFKQMVSCGCKRNQFGMYGKQLTVQAEKNFSPSLTPFLFNSLPASHSPLEVFFLPIELCLTPIPIAQTPSRFSLTVSLPHSTS